MVFVSGNLAGDLEVALVSGIHGVGGGSNETNKCRVFPSLETEKNQQQGFCKCQVTSLAIITWSGFEGIPGIPVFRSVNFKCAARGGETNDEQGHHERKLYHGKCLVHPPTESRTEVLQETDNGESDDANEPHEVLIDTLRDFLLGIVLFLRAARGRILVVLDTEKKEASNLHAVGSRVEEYDKGNRISDVRKEPIT